MTTDELCKSAGLSRPKVQRWIESGLLEAELIANPADSRCREFAADQVERVRLIQALQSKGVALAQLAGRDLAFPNGERFVIFDGHEMRAYRDAAAAIAAVVRAKRWCSAVDLATIRRPPYAGV